MDLAGQIYFTSLVVAASSFVVMRFEGRGSYSDLFKAILYTVQRASFVCAVVGALMMIWL